MTGYTTYWPIDDATLAAFRIPGAHDPRDLRLGIWRCAGDVELPGYRQVLLSGDRQTGGAALPAELAATAFRLTPTRQYGRSLTVASDNVHIPGLLDRAVIRHHGSGRFEKKRERALETDIGTLCAVLMRGLSHKRQAGKARTVVTAGYRIPPSNPESRIFPLMPKLESLDRWAREFAREHRVPLLLAELEGDTVYEERESDTGRPYNVYQGRRLARVASIATTDEATADLFVCMARLILD